MRVRAEKKGLAASVAVVLTLKRITRHTAVPSPTTHALSLYLSHPLCFYVSPPLKSLRMTESINTKFPVCLY